MATIISELGHTGRKIDCEGCEWDKVMPVAFDAIHNGTLDIDQVQVEVLTLAATFESFTRNGTNGVVTAISVWNMRL